MFISGFTAFGLLLGSGLARVLTILGKQDNDLARMIKFRHRI